MRLLFMFFVLCFSAQNFSKAQYYLQSAEDARSAGETYDERGYGSAAAVSVDGNLVVSNQNGNVSYSYPISSYSRFGHPVNVSLNYSGSVSHTSYSRYMMGSSVIGYGCDNWMRFQSNQPLWMISVNGFAVQTLGFNSNYVVNPATIVDTNRTSFGNADLLWTVDGYDVMNRMRPLLEGCFHQDEIKILRGDGSVMVLKNSYSLTNSEPGAMPSGCTSQGAYDCDSLYIGHYYVDGPDAQGYALVEYNSTAWSDAIFGKSWAQAEAQEKTRVVRYYPGDGLEYVFMEWKSPFGEIPFREEQWYDFGHDLNMPNADNLSQTDLNAHQHAAVSVRPFGNSLAHPTVFYLQEINTGSRTVVEFTYSRHNQINPFGSSADKTRGRAFLSEFTDHELAYTGNSITFTTGGRTTSVKIGESVKYGKGAHDHLPASYGNFWYNMNTIAMGAILFPDFFNVKSLVTEIVDPQYRRTKFEYEDYERRYEEYKFPQRENISDHDDYFLVSGKRLKTVETSLDKKLIAYSGEVDEVLNYNAVPAFTDGIDDRLLHIADTVLSYGYNGGSTMELLTRELYTFNTGLENDKGFSSGTHYEMQDVVGGAKQEVSFLYQRKYLPAPISDILYHPNNHWVKTMLLGTVKKSHDPESSDIFYEASSTVYDSITPFLYLPVSVSTRVATSQGDWKRTSLKYIDYDSIAPFYSYHGAPNVDGIGYRVFKSSTRVFSPDSIHMLTKRSEYIHLPRTDTSFTYVAKQWDKTESYIQALQIQQI